MRKTGIAGVILAALLSFAGAVTVQADDSSGQERAMEGIYIENMNVSGMNQEEIRQAIQGKMEKLSQSTIELCVGDSGTGITAGELGLAYTNEVVIRQALEIGQKGNVLQRFRTQRTIKENGPLVLELAYEVDQEKVRGLSLIHI